MTQITNGELPELILNFTGFNIVANEKTNTGLINEKIKISVKNRIQKIVKILEAEYTDYKKVFIELLLKHGGEKTGDNITLSNEKNTEEFKTEFAELLLQKITLPVFDKIDFKMIENIETDENYNFSVLAKFFENYE